VYTTNSPLRQIAVLQKQPSLSYIQTACNFHRYRLQDRVPGLEPIIITMALRSALALLAAVGGATAQTGALEAAVARGGTLVARAQSPQADSDSRTVRRMG
jgi:hypothetical protein